MAKKKETIDEPDTPTVDESVDVAPKVTNSDKVLVMFELTLPLPCKRCGEPLNVENVTEVSVSQVKPFGSTISTPHYLGEVRVSARCGVCKGRTSYHSYDKVLRDQISAQQPK